MTRGRERDLLALDDLDAAEIVAILRRSQELGALWSARRMPQSLAGMRVALVVNDDGWRNTTAFDLGVRALGGLCVHAPLCLDRREALGDLAAYLDNWFDAVVSRAPELAVLRALADFARAPVVNARTRQNHPCETLGDLAYYWHRTGGIDGIKVAVVAPEANILGSWIEAARALPLQVVQVYPERWHVAQSAAGGFRSTADRGELDDADIIVTDCWPEGAEAEELQPYQIDARLLDRLKPELAFIPCPPLRRGQEVSEDAMVHRSCCVIEAKAFLMHAQNAALEWVAGKL